MSLQGSGPKGVAAYAGVKMAATEYVVSHTFENAPVVVS
jgi:hypothetical protein